MTLYDFYSNINKKTNQKTKLIMPVEIERLFHVDQWAMECPICLEELTNPDEEPYIGHIVTHSANVELPTAERRTNHVFHETCLIQSLQEKQECPECRAPVNNAHEYGVTPNFTSTGWSPEAQEVHEVIQQQTLIAQEPSSLQAPVNDRRLSLEDPELRV